MGGDHPRISLAGRFFVDVFEVGIVRHCGLDWQKSGAAILDGTFCRKQVAKEANEVR